MQKVRRNLVLGILVFIFLDTKERNEYFEMCATSVAYIYIYIYIYMCVCVCVYVCVHMYKTREIVNLRFIKFDIEGFYKKLFSHFANSSKFV